ncbi:hypothetical protein FACS1894195_1710 [Bacteroidia bacterium]|nr:hypothetical protein FACS1894195_1710 [Bacteroidia bacterium]
MVFSAFSQTGTVLWQIGTQDNSGKEFALCEALGYEKFLPRFKHCHVLYEVGKTKTSDIPFFLPGPGDFWGNHQKGQLTVRFGIEQIENDCGAKLRINFLDVHPNVPVALQIEVGDFKTTVHPPKGVDEDYLEHPQLPTKTKELFVEVDIPAGSLQKGDNALVIQDALGCWIAFDNITLTTTKQAKVGKISSPITLTNVEANPVLLRGKGDELLQPISLNITNWETKPLTADIRVDGGPTKKVKLGSGVNVVDINAPETNVAKEVTVSVSLGKTNVIERKIKQLPVKKMTIYLVQHTHTDIGYTKPQTEILTEHLRYIDYAIEYCRQTENYPDDAKFRWTCEASWAVREYLACRPKEQIEKLKKYIRNGQIEVTAMFFNMSEIIDENSFKTFLAPIRAFKAEGIPVKVAMQNDVNGIAWCLADYFPDLGVKYVWMGEHGHRALIPFDKPTVFNWESPSGKSLVAFRAEHYMMGNFWGIDRGQMDEIKPKLIAYIQQLENKNYPYDAIGVQYSGYYTDNSPPSVHESDFIRAWNEKVAYPRLRSSVASEFMDYVSNKYASQFTTQRVAYPDWWTDGFGSAARETGASRKTHSDMLTIEGMLSMAALKAQKLPDNINEKIAHTHDNLLFYDEHTFGAAESVSDPMCDNSQVQWAEKAAYVWEGLKSAQMLYETSAGLLQNELHRGKYPTLTFFNTLNWPRTEVAVKYIDFELVPRDAAFKIVDDKGIALKVQPIRSRNEGRYYAILAENIPAMGYKTFNIVVENAQDSKVSKASKNSPVSKSSKLPEVPDEANILENEYYKITFDAQKGAISNLFDKKLQKELVDKNSPWSLGAFMYEKISDRHQMELYTLTNYERTGLSECTLQKGVDGPIYKTVNISGKSLGCEDGHGVKIEVRLYHNSKRIELAYSIKRLPEIDPTGLYVAFPFQLDNAKLTFDVQGGTVFAGENQLEATATEWNTVQNFVAARNKEAQIVVGSDLVPLFQLGSLIHEKFQRKNTYEKPHVFSFVMNNYWVTNFKAFQDGEFNWSYYLTSTDDVSNTAATKFGWSSRVPLYGRVMPQGDENNKAAEYSAFHFDKANLLMTSCTPSATTGNLMNQYVLLNVRELDGQATELSIFDASGNKLSFDVVNALEEPILKDLKQVAFKAFENKFIRLKQ